ncbi:MAG TPA: 50S ribosomal protein L21 [Saprospiraceae bacterium]|nr:50S ribosomal protein L21 [Saprospiraceae bacterium]
MFAIVSIAGQQFKVSEGQEIFVHQLGAEQGQQIVLNDVHLIKNDDQTLIGTPVLNGVEIKATILDHVKGDKVIVFKKKRRKGYKVKNGHRQRFTKLKIDHISA